MGAGSPGPTRARPPGRPPRGLPVPSPMNPETDPDLDRVIARALRRAKDLPSPPAVVVRVIELTRDPNCRIEDLAAAIGQDPALATRLMRLANSSLYGVRFKVTDIEQAAVLMGMRTLKQLCIGLSLTSNLTDEGVDEENGFPVQIYWQHSLVAAVAAREIARRVGSPQANEAFLCGLLARMGQLLLARCLPDKFEPVLDQCRLREQESELPSAEIERALLGFHHGSFGAAILRSWGLPEPIPTAVEWSADLTESEVRDDTDARDLALFTHIGETAAGVLVESNKGASLAHLRELGTDRLGLEAQAIDAFILDLEGHVKEAARLMGREAPEGPSFADRLETARDEILASRGIPHVEPVEETARPRPLEAVRSSELANLDEFANRLATHVRLRLEGFDHLCLGVLLIDVGGAPAEDVGRAAQHLRANVRNSDMCARLDGSVLGVVAPSTTPQALRLLGTRLSHVLLPDQDEGASLVVGGVCIRHFADPSDHAMLFREAHDALASARTDGRGVEVRYHRSSTKAA